MPKLFSYRIPWDGGSAPNPFWGYCTLAICKPRIRLSAAVKDWVVGTGSARSPIGDISNKVVYAMCVTDKKTMKEYDKFTRSKLPRKIPLLTSSNPRRHVGDSIYDYSISNNTTPYPALRRGVHDDSDRDTDLNGSYVLLSNHFFYFGDQPVTLPENLMGIVKKGPGHKTISGQQYDDFISWLESLGYPPATLIGKPQMMEEAQNGRSGCSRRDREEEEADLSDFDPPPGKRC
jgi:Nucleotide modification associated domain 2